MLRDELDDAALGLGDVALGLELRRFGNRCHRYSRETHYHYFCDRVFDVLSQTTMLLRRLRHCPGRLLSAGCSAGGEWLLTPEGTAREEQGRGLLCHPRHHNSAER